MEKKEEIIMGVDPGTKITGYGIILKEGNQLKAIDYGCIRPPSSYKLSDRYLIIYESLLLLLEKFCPSCFIVETQYVQKNVQSAIKLGMARGTCILAAKKKSISVFEYTPTHVKKAVVGYGRAGKMQMQKMMQTRLQLQKLPEPDDLADALGLAVCHAQSLFKPKEI